MRKKTKRIIQKYYISALQEIIYEWTSTANEFIKEDCAFTIGEIGCEINRINNLNDTRISQSPKGGIDYGNNNKNKNH